MVMMRVRERESIQEARATFSQARRAERLEEGHSQAGILGEA
jgi:hypothetical protein